MDRWDVVIFLLDIWASSCQPKAEKGPGGEAAMLRLCRGALCGDTR